MISSQDGQILDLVVACAATIGAIVADEGAIAEKKEVCVGIEEGTTSVASETVNVPSIASCVFVSITASQGDGHGGGSSIPSSKAFPSSRIYFFRQANRQSRGLYHSRRREQLKTMSGVGRTSPQPLHGYAASSCSMGDSGYPVGESIIKAMVATVT